MEKKKFWDTKVGAILKQVAPSAIELVGDVVPGGKLLKTIFNSEVMNNPVISDEEKVLAKHEFTIALKEYEARERQMILDDVANARAMQTAALGQGDLFSKRFVYYLAAFIMIALFALLIMLFFIEIPDGNNEIVYMAVGIFMGIATTVAAFFFGSSQGSKEKDAGLAKALQPRKR